MNPTDPSHIGASFSNDYDSCCDGFYTSFDGGQTWTQGNMSAEDDKRIGSDPVTVFDPVTGNVIHASLNFLINKDGLGKDGDVVVSISKDGGVTWGRPVVVLTGQGNDEFADADLQRQGMDRRRHEPVVAVLRTHLPHVVAVREPRRRLRGVGDLRGAQRRRREDLERRTRDRRVRALLRHPVRRPRRRMRREPVLGTDGRARRHRLRRVREQQNSSIQEPGEEFGNEQQIHDNQYLVVRSDDGGVTWSAPVIAATLEDGPTNYPVNVLGRQTLTGYQTRTNSAGNIVASHTGDLFLVWSDNRNGTSDPLAPVTNTDVFISTSVDGGATWSAPSPVDAGPGDQWFPWVDVDPTTGGLAIVYHTRNDPDPALYNTAVATGSIGSFTIAQVSTKPSNPTRSVFFKAKTPGCFACSTFIGDYNRLAFGSDGVAHVTWTDMRRPYPKANKPPQYLQFLFYRQMP